MIKKKKKICAGCNTEQYIWKNHEGSKFCKQCWSTHESKNIKKPTIRKEIPRVSAKRKKQDAEYLKLRIEFLNEHKMCQAKLPGCSNFATDVHHTKGGADRAEYYLNVDSFMAVCR